MARDPDVQQVFAYLNTAREDRDSLPQSPQVKMFMAVPYFFSFDTRLQLFRSLVGFSRAQGFGGNLHIQVRRDSMLQDAFEQLGGGELLSSGITLMYELAQQFKKNFGASFVSSTGVPEAGYGIGVTREFLQG